MAPVPVAWPRPQRKVCLEARGWRKGFTTEDTEGAQQALAGIPPNCATCVIRRYLIGLRLTLIPPASHLCNLRNLGYPPPFLGA